MIHYSTKCMNRQPLTVTKKQISLPNPSWNQSLFVAENLIHQKAVLLPWVCQVFLDAYLQVPEGSKSTPSPTLEVGESTVKFSSRWLLNQLISHLNQHMSYKCIHKKFGTLLHHKGGDVLVSLSWALSNSNMHADNETAHVTLHENAETDKLILYQASKILNHLFQEESKRLFSAKDESLLYFDVDTYLGNVNLLLVQF